MNVNYEPSEQQVLEEDYDENYEPTEDEVLEYCKVLDLDPMTEKDLLYIAKEGIKAPLPKEWKPVEDSDGNIYYFNFSTGESTWEHPCDEYYRKQLQQEREKKRMKASVPGSKAKSGHTGKKKGVVISSKAGGGGKPMTNGGQPSGMSHPGMMMKGGVAHPAMMMNGHPGMVMAGGVSHPGMMMSGGVSHPVMMMSGGGAHPGMMMNGGGHILGGAGSVLGGGGGRLMSGQPPLGKISQQRSPAHGKLAPLSQGGNKPLPSIAGLPPLKAPPSLAPLRVPSAMSQASNSHGQSLTSTGGSDSVKSADLLLTSGNRSTGLATIELGGGGISNKFEEEDEESESSSEFGADFKSKLGVNLLGAEDLGIKDSEEDILSTEDVSKELQKILDLDKSEKSSDDESAPVGIPDRPSAPAPRHPVLGGVSSGVSEDSPVSSPRVRPRAAKTRDISNYKSSPETSRPPLQSAIHSVTQSSAMNGSAVGGSGMFGRGGLDSPARIQLNVSPQHRQIDMTKEIKVLQDDHMSMLNQLKANHSKEVDELQKQFTKEIEDLKESIVAENESKMALFRKELATEQITEEKELQAKKASFLSDLKARLKGEEEDEEAKIMESKQDSIRKLKQQVAQEQENEEIKLRKEKDLALMSLRQKLESEHAAEEAKIRSAATAKLFSLQETLDKEFEDQKKTLKVSHEQEIEAFRQHTESELKEKRTEMERDHKKELESLQTQLQEEHAKAVKAAQAEVEKSYSLQEAKEHALQLHKQSEEEMKTQLAAELEAKKEEILNQHKAEMVSLKEQLVKELSQVQEEEGQKIDNERERLMEELESIIQEHESKIQQMQSEHKAIQEELERHGEEHSQELVTLESEYQCKKEELVRLQSEVDQQLSQLESKKRELQEKETELKMEEAHLEHLRSASAKETEELLQKQQSELKAGIDKEKKTLSSLKKSSNSLEAELQQLQEERTSLDADVKRLREEEEVCRSQLLELHDQLKQERASLEQIKREREIAKASFIKKTPLHSADDSSLARVPNKAQASVFSQVPVDNGRQRKRVVKKPVSTGCKDHFIAQEMMCNERSDQEDEDEETASSMNVRELELPATKPKAQVDSCSDSEVSSMLLEGVKARLTDNQRELQHTLNEEQESLARTKEYLKQQQKTLKKRRQALKQAHQEWSDDMNSRTVHASEDTNVNLLKEIQSKLDQEAAALDMLEERMKSSNQLLALKEQVVNQLQQVSLDDDEVESPSDEEPPSLPHDAPFDVSSSKAYISQLKASLEKSRQYSRLKSPKLQVGKEKKRHMTSPLPLQSSRVTRNARRKLYELRNKDSSDESSENNDMFSSSTTDVEEETNHFKRRHHSMPKATPSSRTHFSPTTKRILNGGRVADTTSTLPNHNTLHSQGASLIHPSATRADPEVMGSLNAINSQLGELLNRLEHPLPPPAAATYVPPSHTSPSWYGDHENRAAGTTSLKSSRWADPVRRIDQSEALFPRNHHPSMSGHHHSSVPPPPPLFNSTHSSRSTSIFEPASLSAKPHVSTEELLKNQTDWLKEFRQSVPLASRLQLGSNHTHTCTPSTSAPHHTPTVAGTVGGQQNMLSATLLPSKPKLTLDKSNKIRVIRV